MTIHPLPSQLGRASHNHSPPRHKLNTVRVKPLICLAMWVNGRECTMLVGFMMSLLISTFVLLSGETLFSWSSESKLFFLCSSVPPSIFKHSQVTYFFQTAQLDLSKHKVLYRGVWEKHGQHLMHLTDENRIFLTFHFHTYNYIGMFLDKKLHQQAPRITSPYVVYWHHVTLFLYGSHEKDFRCGVCVCARTHARAPMPTTSTFLVLITCVETTFSRLPIVS